MTRRTEIAERGFAIWPALLDGDVVRAADAAIDAAFSGGASERLVRRREGRPYAIRDALAAAPELSALAINTRLMAIATATLGVGARCVRATVFDKPVDGGWGLPQHRDEMIAVRERHDVAGFGPWSVKAGIPHVRPPDAVLRSMLAVRVSIDANDAANGALEVVPGTHLGVTDPRPDVPRNAAFVSCATDVGGVVAMRPLLLHGSPEPVERRRRRVVHFEYAADPLPSPLVWLHELRPSATPPTGAG